MGPYLFPAAAAVTLRRSREKGRKVRSLDDAFTKLNFCVGAFTRAADRPLPERDPCDVFAWLCAIAAVAQMAAEDLGLDAAVLCDVPERRGAEIDELLREPDAETDHGATEDAEKKG